MTDSTPTSDLDDQMREAIRRQREHGERAAWVDRRGWTTEQWCDDAERLMHDIDGAITSLVNGHVNALIRERRRLAAALRAATSARDTAWAEVDGLRADLATARTVTRRLIESGESFSGMDWRYWVESGELSEAERVWLASVAATPASEESG